MKKISAIIAVLAVAAVFVFTGCQKQEAPKSTVESVTTTTTAAPASTTTTTTTTPATK